jgi:organic radical activating enzyme
MKAKISEIFKSIQGEGIYQGQEQVFVRFYGCNLSCSFCDTKLDFYEEKATAEIIENINTYKDFSAVSLTGGEPLLQIEFLDDLCRELKSQGKTIYLETNGTLFNNLRRIISYLDIIAMDFKLPSSTTQKQLWFEHREFLKSALAKEVFIKLVIGKDTLKDDIASSIKLIKEIEPNLEVVLQPENLYERELTDKLEIFLRTFKVNGIKARVTPQLHKQLGIR